MTTSSRNAFFFLCLILIGSGSCRLSVNTNVSGEREELMKTDSAFSNLSASKGMKAAFLSYMDSSGVLLRPQHFPLVGEDARRYLEQLEDTSYSLTWAPVYAEISRAADLGYTYGTYTFKNRDTTLRGTYVSIWKKQADGEWKFVLDTGNPGVGGEK